MNKFSFIKSNGNGTTIYPLTQPEILSINRKINIPKDLAEFFKFVGYGFINKGNNIHRLLDPQSFMEINLKLNYYEFDPDLELYDSYEGRKIFFEVNEGVYLMIDDEINNIDSNNIYYFEDKIANSLEEFLSLIIENCDFLKNINL